MFKIFNFEAMLFIPSRSNLVSGFTFRRHWVLESCCSFANTVFYIVIQNANHKFLCFGFVQLRFIEFMWFLCFRCEFRENIWAICKKFYPNTHLKHICRNHLDSINLLWTNPKYQYLHDFPLSRKNKENIVILIQTGLSKNENLTGNHDNRKGSTRDNRILLLIFSSLLCLINFIFSLPYVLSFTC